LSYGGYMPNNNVIYYNVYLAYGSKISSLTKELFLSLIYVTLLYNLGVSLPTY